MAGSCSVVSVEFNTRAGRGSKRSHRRLENVGRADVLCEATRLRDLVVRTTGARESGLDQCRTWVNGRKPGACEMGGCADGKFPSSGNSNFAVVESNHLKVVDNPDDFLNADWYRK